MTVFEFQRGLQPDPRHREPQAADQPISTSGSLATFASRTVWGFAGAVGAATATVATALRDLFRRVPLHAPLPSGTLAGQHLRAGLVPVTIGLIVASGVVMARAADVSWAGVALTAAATFAMLGTRLNPLWLLAAGGAAGGLGFLA